MQIQLNWLGKLLWLGKIKKDGLQRNAAAFLLELNPAKTIMSSVITPNRLTLSRIFFPPIIGVLLLSGFRGAASIAFVLFVIASITDWLDGWLARRRGLSSTFGKLMDATSDKILISGLMVLLLTFPEVLPRICALLVVVILTREFMVMALRMIAACQNIVLAAEQSGKIKTTAQLLCVGSFLLSLALKNDWGQHGALQQFTWGFGMVTLILSTLLAVYSGYFYAYKNWHLVKSF